MGDYDGGAAIFVAPAATGGTKVEALPVPVGADAAIAMEKALKGQEYGKVQTLTVAQGLVNRDGGVFDNLPYGSTGKSKFAKKDLYDRIRGKDWPGRSLKPQNVFSALKERFGKKAKVRLEDAERADDKAPDPLFFQHLQALLLPSSRTAPLEQKTRSGASGSGRASPCP